MEIKLNSAGGLDKEKLSESGKICRNLDAKFKPVEELTFSDDYLFGTMMYRKRVCAGVIKSLLNIEVKKISYPEVQKAINPFYDSKGIRMDVLAQDGKTLYNIEMQNTTPPSLPLRMRYYQGLLDVDSLMKGQKYDNLCQSYVIFICKKDPFGQKRPVYTFTNTCQEDFSLIHNDKSVKIYYNVSAWESDGNSERRSLLRYIDSGVATNGFTRRLQELAEEVKNTNRFRRQYMMRNIYLDDAMERGIEQGIERGMSMGAEQTTRSNIISFYKNDVPVSVIAKSLGKTEEEVEEIIRSELEPVATK